MNKKELFINMSASVIGFLFSLGVSFFLSPYIVNNIGKESYGFMNLGNQFVSYAAIATTALNSMLSRFVTIEIYRNNNEERDKYFSSAILTNIVLSLILIIPCFLLVVFLERVVSIPSEIIFDVKLLWAFIFFNFLLTLITNSYSIAVFAKNKLYLNSLRGIESKVINIAILIVMFGFFKPSIWYVGLANIFCSVYNLIYNIYYTKKFFPDMKCKVGYFSFGHLKRLLSSGIWNAFSQLASILNNGFDLLICNLFVNATAMGTMSLAKVIPLNIAAFIPLIGDAFLPEFTKNFALDDKELLFKNIDFSRKIMAFISAIAVGVAIINCGGFFKLWVPKENSSTLQLIAAFSLLSTIFTSSLTSVTNALVVANKHKVPVIWYFVGGIVNLILVFILLTLVDSGVLAVSFISKEVLQMLIIAGVSGILVIVRCIVILPLYASKCFGYKWYAFYPTMIRTVVTTLAVIFVTLFVGSLVPITSWLTFIINCVISVVIGGLLSIIILFNKAQIKILFENISNRILRKKANQE